MPIANQIPTEEASVHLTTTGFKLAVERDGTPLYIKKWNRSKIMLSEHNIGPLSETFIALRQEVDEFTPQSNLSHKTIICGATGFVASQRLAEGTHRLATTEEIHQFRQDQIAREQECYRIESEKPEKRDAAAAREQTKTLTEVLTKMATPETRSGESQAKVSGKKGEN